MIKKIIRLLLAIIPGIFVGVIFFTAIDQLVKYKVYLDCPTYTIPCITSSPWGIMSEALSFTAFLFIGLWIYIFFKVSGKFIK